MIINCLSSSCMHAHVPVQVNLVLSLEAKFSFLPFIRHGKVPPKSQLKVKKDRLQKWHTWFKHLLIGEDYSSIEHISSTLNPTKVHLNHRLKHASRQ